MFFLFVFNQCMSDWRRKGNARRKKGREERSRTWANNPTHVPTSEKKGSKQTDKNKNRKRKLPNLEWKILGFPQKDNYLCAKNSYKNVAIFSSRKSICTPTTGSIVICRAWIPLLANAINLHFLSGGSVTPDFPPNGEREKSAQGLSFLCGK